MSRIKFQLGGVSGKQAGAVVVLLGMLWAVFPSSKSEPSKNEATASDVAGENSDSANVQQAASSDAGGPSSAVASDASAGSGGAASLALEKSGTAMPTAVLIGKPYEMLDKADVDALASISPFSTTAVDVAIRKKDTVADAATEEAPEEKRRRMLQGKAAGANVSLVYSSSRGTRAAVINREILKPGMTTSDGLEIHSVEIDGVGVRLQSDSMPDDAGLELHSESPADSVRQD
ncbi:MAG: hypothetical protein U0996_02600 [Planctomycetaceae bacterium]